MPILRFHLFRFATAAGRLYADVYVVYGGATSDEPQQKAQHIQTPVQNWQQSEWPQPVNLSTFFSLTSTSFMNTFIFKMQFCPPLYPFLFFLCTQIKLHWNQNGIHPSLSQELLLINTAGLWFERRGEERRGERALELACMCMKEINCGRKCNACTTACNACKLCCACRMVFAVQRASRRHPTQNDSLSTLFADAGSAGSERASFGLPDCIGLLSAYPLIPRPQPSTFLFALPLLSMPTNPKLPQ